MKPIYFIERNQRNDSHFMCESICVEPKDSLEDVDKRLFDNKHGAIYSYQNQEYINHVVSCEGTSKKQLQQICESIANLVLRGDKRLSRLDLNYGVFEEEWDEDLITFFFSTLSKTIITKAYRADKENYKKRCKNILYTDRYERVGELSKPGIDAAKGIIENNTLGEMPGNELNPDTYVERVMSDNWLSKKANKKVTKYVLREEELEDLGMNVFLSVGNASQYESALIALEYFNADDHNADPVVLVGKGITFDSGGISLKPGAKMDEMKFDMGGSAAVAGAFKTIVESGAKVNVVALLAVAENMPGRYATRPGDVIKSMSGQTVEILNTDAEGRLVLCDTLTYAKRYDPRVIVDVATLTGSAVATFGDVVSAMMTNHETTGRSIQKLGSQIGDRVWPLPLYKEYGEMLKSKNADLANLGGGAGCITAGAFLSKFVDKKQRWAHLDIAGTAWKGKQATGRTVELLTAFTLQEFGVPYYSVK